MKLLGNYKSLNVGYSIDKEIRNKGASGGIVSSLLIIALKKRLIDGIVVVAMDNKHPWKPKVKIARTRKDILSAAGSKYTLIPIKEILDAIDKEDKKTRLAIVGLPCHINIIRNLQKIGKYNNIKFVIGLFCGYNMPAKATDFLIKKTGVDKKDIESLEYRGGKYPGGFLIKTKKGKTKFFPKYYYDIVNLMFVPKGCLICKDYMNEFADVSVGDSWGYDNSSLVVVRTKQGEKLLNSTLIKLTPLSEKEVMKMHWHNIKHKKIGDSLFITFSMIFLKIFGRFIPFQILGKFAKIRRKISGK